MLRKLCVVLLVATVFAAPAAFASGPVRVIDRQPSLVERVWDGLAQLFGLDRQRMPEDEREPEEVRSVSGQDDCGGGVDPDG